MSQQIFRIGPAFILLTNQIFNRNTHISEKHIIHLMPAFNRNNRTNFNARRIHIKQNKGNPFLRLAFTGGPHKTEHLVSILPKRRPGFLPVDHIMIPVPDRRRAKRCQIRP